MDKIKKSREEFLGVETEAKQIGTDLFAFVRGYFPTGSMVC